MKLSLRCSELAQDKECDFVAKGETEDEVFHIMAEHFKAVHGLYGASKPIKDVFRRSLRSE
jgi:predicted small metal-binding protein